MELKINTKYDVGDCLIETSATNYTPERRSVAKVVEISWDSSQDRIEYIIDISYPPFKDLYSPDGRYSKAGTDRVRMLAGYGTDLRFWKKLPEVEYIATLLMHADTEKQYELEKQAKKLENKVKKNGNS